MIYLAKDSSIGGSIVVHRTTRPRLSDCGKSRSLDSSELFPSTEQMVGLSPGLLEHVEEARASDEIAQNEVNVRKETAEALDSKKAEPSLKSDKQQQNNAKPVIVAERVPSSFEPSCLSPIK